MKALSYITILLVALSSTIASAQQAPGTFAITPIDGFRGLKWGATAEEIQAKLEGKRYEINGIPTQSISIASAKMFDLFGEMVYIIKRDGLVAGRWIKGYSLNEREAELIFNALVPKYGMPSRYLVNNAERNFQHPIYAFRSFKVNMDNVDVIWTDGLGNELRVELRERNNRPICYVYYRSRAYVDEMMSEEDH